MRNNKLEFVPNGLGNTAYFIGNDRVEQPKVLKHPVIMGDKVICAITRSNDKDYLLTLADIAGAYLPEEIDTPAWLIRRANIKSA
jgi:hypothetical protein